MDGKNGLLESLPDGESNNIENSTAENGKDDTEKRDLSGGYGIGDMLRRVFFVSMSALSCAALLFGVIYLLGRLDFSSESISRLVIKSVTGHDSSPVRSYQPAKRDTESESETALELPPEMGEEYTPPYFSLTLTNETPYTPDMDELLSSGRVIPRAHELYETYGEGEPLVLILHTHATEGYSDTAGDSYRTEDRSRNVVAIGNRVSDILNKNGIVTLHSTELYDSPDYNMSYYNASLAIRKYLAEYPSIAYIIDIHRDSMLLPDGSYYAPTSLMENGVKAAQMMFVVGTDYGGSGHSGWRDNLSLAARLQCGIMGDYPTLMRDINLRSASFNQQYSKGSLLVEIGSCASDSDEALLSAEIFAEQLSREIIG